MPNMVPPDYGSNMKPEYWKNPDPGLEPVNPHIRPLNRYGTRKTQRKENIYGYTGGGDATFWEPVNYAGYRHYPCYYLSFPSRNSVRAGVGPPLGPGRRAQGHGDVWGRFDHPPSRTTRASTFWKGRILMEKSTGTPEPARGGEFQQGRDEETH